MIEWLQKLVGRPGQRHAFVDGSLLSECRVGRRGKGAWQEAPQAMKCASCVRRVDPSNAPKLPKVRGHV